MLKIIQPLQNAKQSGDVNVKSEENISPKAFVDSQTKFITVCSHDFENVMLSLVLTSQKKTHSPANIHVQIYSALNVSILWSFLHTL